MGQSKPVEVTVGGRCPICKAPSELGFRPFCSRRCSDVDLSRWLKGSYAIQGGDEDADEDGDDAEIKRQTPPGVTSDEDV
jgi:endogenous inhibitor of DNA gyrase (YacG/DUF329 family)